MKGLFSVNPAAYILEPKIRRTNVNFDTYLHSYFPSAILFVEELSETMEYVNQTGIIILDFARAFDDVNHSLLRHKLHHCGVRAVNQRIQNFLEGRRKAVVVDGERPDFTSVRSTVPQGSVLGPSLFLVYANDPRNYSPH